VWEVAAVLLAATVMSLRADWPILFHAYTFQPDAETHTFWMRRFQDSALFTDPLTQALIKAGYVPLGLQFVYRVASFAVDPVVFGPWLGVVLAVLSAWLVFVIVREHTDWWPAAWIGAGLLLLPVQYLKFSGGHARSFDQPIMLLTVFLLLRGRFRVAAIVPAVGALLYPPAAVGALAVMVASCLVMQGGRPRLDRVRVVPAVACAVATGVGLVLPRVLGSQQALITEAQARRLPDFGPNGQMYFFTDSIVSMLKNQYSGFDIKAAFGIILLMTLVLLVLRPQNVLLLRREVLWIPITSLMLYGVAYTVLFQLYLPNRYTYPFLPFCCIAIAVWWRPTFESLSQRLRSAWPLVPLGLLISAATAYLALHVIPLGPEFPSQHLRRMLGADQPATLAIALVIATTASVLAWRVGASGRALVSVAAVLAATLLLAEVAIAGGGVSTTAECTSDPEALAYLGTLPKDAIIAGDPLSLDCVTMVSRRPVVISRKLYQVFSTSYLQIARPRMFAMINAYYGDSVAAIIELRRRYNADYLMVQPATFRAHQLPPAWRHMAPFGSIVAHLMQSTHHAVLGLPSHCRTWSDRRTEIYNLECLATI
jgi:hypothetical protein